MEEAKLLDLLERAQKADPALLGHHIIGGFMSPEIKPISDDLKVIGPAFTVRIPTNDNLVLYHAMQFAPKGSVLVIDRMGEHRIGCVGEMVVRNAMHYGIKGIVVDGPSTDTKAIRELGFPLFSTGRSAFTNILRGADGEFGVPVNCGGATVCPGDIIYGDLDGVIALPQDKLEDAVLFAEGFLKVEEFTKAQFEKGIPMNEHMNFKRAIEVGVGGYLNDLLKMD